MGTGAGLIQSRGLMSLFTKLSPKKSTTKEENYDFKQDEKEFEELMDKIERLQSLGVVKMLSESEKK